MFARGNLHVSRTSKSTYGRRGSVNDWNRQLELPTFISSRSILVSRTRMDKDNDKFSRRKLETFLLRQGYSGLRYIVTA